MLDLVGFFVARVDGAGDAVVELGNDALNTAAIVGAGEIRVHR